MIDGVTDGVGVIDFVGVIDGVIDGVTEGDTETAGGWFLYHTPLMKTSVPAARWGTDPFPDVLVTVALRDWFFAMGNSCEIVYSIYILKSSSNS